MKYSLLLLGGIAASPVFESDKAAKTILTRQKRNNNGIFEETFGANLERECIEEICSFDEVMEVFEDRAKADEWWQQATNQCQKPDACSAQGTKTCVNQWQKHTCECKDGWQGEKCEQDVDECAEEGFCQNGGVCANSIGSFECQCTAGWEGANCENDKDECAIDACLNGASCTNSVGSFSCECTPQWQGDICDTDVDECAASNPCTNDGTCINTQGDYNCLCNNGWGGKNCDADYDECADAHCPAGTQCVATAMNQFTCQCPERGCANLNETVYNDLLASAEADEEEVEATTGSVVDYNYVDTNATDAAVVDYGYDSVDDVDEEDSSSDDSELDYVVDSDSNEEIDLGTDAPDYEAPGTAAPTTIGNYDDGATTGFNGDYNYGDDDSY